MKHFLLIIFMFTALVLPISGQDDAGLSAKIEVAIKAGNAAELAKLMHSSIDLTIPGNEGVYSKTQAELILKDFFSKNNPLEYKTLHKGSSKDGARYCIGNLKTDKGMFRAYFYMKKKGDEYFIHEFSLNSEENDE